MIVTPIKQAHGTNATIPSKIFLKVVFFIVIIPRYYDKTDLGNRKLDAALLGLGVVVKRRAYAMMKLEIPLHRPGFAARFWRRIASSEQQATRSDSLAG